MTNVVSILIFILAFSFLAFVHELGHFLIARLFNIEVEEFGLGFPPRAIRLFNWRGTDFTLNWIPFGAFVRPKGENDPEVAGGLGAAHPLKRLAVLLGGPFMNVIIGILLFSFIFMQTGIPDFSRVEIGGVIQDSAAEQYGLQTGDIIASANGTQISDVEKLRSIIQSSPDQSIAMGIVRDGQDKTIAITPKISDGLGVIGVYLSNPLVVAPWIDTLPYAANISVEYVRQLIALPGKIIMGQISPEQGRLTSVVGLGNMFVQARERDIQAESSAAGTPAVTSLSLVALISVALGITNLLPLPALDGGRIVFLLPELLLRKRIPAKYENTVHMVGFLALLLLMVVVTVQDIVNPINLP